MCCYRIHTCLMMFLGRKKEIRYAHLNGNKIVKEDNRRYLDNLSETTDSRIFVTDEGRSNEQYCFCLIWKWPRPK